MVKLRVETVSRGDDVGKGRMEIRRNARMIPDGDVKQLTDRYII